MISHGVLCGRDEEGVGGEMDFVKITEKNASYQGDIFPTCGFLPQAIW